MNILSVYKSLMRPFRGWFFFGCTCALLVVLFVVLIDFEEDRAEDLLARYHDHLNRLAVLDTYAIGDLENFKSALSDLNLLLDEDFADVTFWDDERGMEFSADVLTERIELALVKHHKNLQKANSSTLHMFGLSDTVYELDRDVEPEHLSQFVREVAYLDHLLGEINLYEDVEVVSAQCTDPKSHVYELSLQGVSHGVFKLLQAMSQMPLAVDAFEAEMSDGDSVVATIRFKEWGHLS